MLRDTKIIQKSIKIDLLNDNNIKYERKTIKNLHKVKLFQISSDEESMQCVIKICGGVSS